MKNSNKLNLRNNVFLRLSSFLFPFSIINQVSFHIDKNRDKLIIKKIKIKWNIYTLNIFDELDFKKGANLSIKNVHNILNKAVYIILNRNISIVSIFKILY